MTPEALVAKNNVSNENMSLKDTGKQNLKFKKLKATFSSASNKGEHMSTMNIPNIII